jgi:hypothetical protein
MDIDLNKVRSNDREYVDSIIQNLMNSSWEELKTAKLGDASDEELRIMKNLWSHGFTKGCEAATRISTYMWEAIQKKESNATV